MSCQVPVSAYHSVHLMMRVDLLLMACDDAVEPARGCRTVHRLCSKESHQNYSTVQVLTWRKRYQAVDFA